MLTNLRSKLLYALAFSVSVALTSCGTVTAPLAVGGLNGNWNLAGDRALGQYPLLSTTLTVNGNQITGAGDMFVECPNGIGFGGTVGFTGQIAGDGTFHLTQPPPPGQLPPPSFQATIDGSVPAHGSTTWSGTYTTTASISATCQNFSEKGNFTATAFAPVNGIYAGQIAAGQPGYGGGVSMQVTEMPPTTIQRANGSMLTLYPLNATISVAGSSCFKQGTTEGDQFPSYVSGDIVNLGFVMDDGSQLLVTGWMTDTTEKYLAQTAFVVTGGKCKGNFGAGDLTKQ